MVSAPTCTGIAAKLRRRAATVGQPRVATRLAQAMGLTQFAAQPLSLLGVKRRRIGDLRGTWRCQTRQEHQRKQGTPTLQRAR